MTQHQTKQHEELMALLHQVPGVSEHLESFHGLDREKDSAAPHGPYQDGTRPDGFRKGFFHDPSDHIEGRGRA